MYFEGSRSWLYYRSGKTAFYITAKSVQFHQRSSAYALLIQDKVYGRFLREEQIGNAGLAWSTGDCAGNPERGRVEKRAAA